MLDITLSNFEHDVIEASRLQPVLLDIWAPWCGPCKALGPVLEKLEADYEGRFMLAKLNADDQQEIAGQLSRMFGVRSIPFCVLFDQGQPVDGFVGALPEAEVRSFLDKHVRSTEAIAGQEEAERAGEMLSTGRVDEAITALRHALENDPDNDTARFACLRALIEAGRLDEAREVYQPAAGRGTPATDDLAACGVWLQACEMTSGAEHPTDATEPSAESLEQHFQHALQHLAASRFTQALDELLEIIRRDRSWGEGRARTTFLAILRLLRAKETSVASDADAGQHAPSLLSPTLRPRASDADMYHRRLTMLLF